MLELVAALLLQGQEVRPLPECVFNERERGCTLGEAAKGEEAVNIDLSRADYARLRESCADRAETRNSAEWTDHNIHDPGVSMAEFLCYALTDMERGGCTPTREGGATCEIKLIHPDARPD
jgi:hypothetical protein